MPACRAQTSDRSDYPFASICSAIKNATTAERLQQLAEVHASSMNHIHVAAILTKLANISKKTLPQSVAVKTSAFALRSLQTRQRLIQQLQQQLRQNHCEGHCTRGLSNIVWALAKLQCSPDIELLRMLVQKFYSLLPSAVPQDVANGEPRVLFRRHQAAYHGNAC